jgi:hypothetical protein
MAFAAPRLSPSAAIRPPLMPMSQRNVSDAVATVPPAEDGVEAHVRLF